MACFLDCPHPAGQCIAAHRSFLRALSARHRWLDWSRQRRVVAELQAQARRERAAVRSVARFLRWGMKQPALIH
jgi:hypothetical protein